MAATGQQFVTWATACDGCVASCTADSLGGGAARAGFGHRDGAGRAGPCVTRDHACVRAGVGACLAALATQFTARVRGRSVGSPHRLACLSAEAKVRRRKRMLHVLAPGATPRLVAVNSCADSSSGRGPLTNAAEVVDTRTFRTRPRAVLAQHCTKADDAVVGLRGELRLKALAHFVQFMVALACWDPLFSSPALLGGSHTPTLPFRSQRHGGTRCICCVCGEAEVSQHSRG
jgi:hypothetical protein